MQSAPLIKVLILVLFWLSNASYAGTQGTDPAKPTKEKREIQNFNSIHICGAGQIYLKQGSKESIVIETESNYFDKIRAEVINNTLYLNSNDLLLANKTLNYHVTVKNLQDIQIAGEASLSSKDTITSKELTVITDGASKVNLKIKVNQFKANIVGNSHVKVLGSAATQVIEITGAGILDAKKLQTKSTKVIINGAGNANIKAISDLDVKISGFGIVNYYGHPKITQEISGHGEIIPVG